MIKEFALQAGKYFQASLLAATNALAGKDCKDEKDTKEDERFQDIKDIAANYQPGLACSMYALSSKETVEEKQAGHRNCALSYTYHCKPLCNGCFPMICKTYFQPSSAGA